MLHSLFSCSRRQHISCDAAGKGGKIGLGGDDGGLDSLAFEKRLPLAPREPCLVGEQ